jgi:hypothetical protein
MRAVQAVDGSVRSGNGEFGMHLGQRSTNDDEGHGRRRASAILVCALVAALIPLGGPGAGATTRPAPPAGPGAPGVHDTVNPADLLDFLPSSRLRAPLPTTLAGDVPPTNHTVDVAMVAPANSAGATGLISDTEVAGLITQMGAYWKVQSNGQVVSLALNPSIKRYSSGLTCDNYSSIWTEAAAAFGHSDLSYYVTNQSHHLLVFAPAGCGPVGLGSLGSYFSPVSTGNGGTIWASMAGANNLDIIAHEFGHNLGLQHSNTHWCPNASMSEGTYDAGTGTFSDGCSDVPYGDAYDVMGAARSMNYNGILYANLVPTSLNVTQKDRLGVLAAGEMQSVSLPLNTATLTTSAALASTGTVSTLRDLKVTDPLTGQIYYVDFRGGAGGDLTSLYATGYMKSLGADVGVRLLTTRSDGSSIDLLSSDVSTQDGHKLYLTAGQRITTRSGGLTLTVNSISGDVASVSVTLGAPVVVVPPVLTPPAALTGVWMDFTGDRQADLLSRDSEGVLWLYPGKRPGFGTRIKIGTGWNGFTSIVAGGDFNSDGKADVIARDTAGVLWLYPGTGSRLGSRVKIGTGWGSLTAIVEARDLNSDGKPDIVARDGSGVLWLYPGTGSGAALKAFGPRARIGAGWNSMTSLAAGGDLSQDGKPDLLARDGAGDLWLYRGTGSGAALKVLGARIKIGRSWNSMTWIAMGGDLNGDGKSDVLSRDLSGYLWLYPGTGSGLGARIKIGSGWKGLTPIS